MKIYVDGERFFGSFNASATKPTTTMKVTKIESGIYRVEGTDFTILNRPFGWEIHVNGDWGWSFDTKRECVAFVAENFSN